MVVKNNQEKPSVFIQVRKDEYPDNPERSGYQTAEINVFLSVGIPSSCSSGTFRLTYQRNYDKEINGMSHWYGETIENIADPRSEKLKDISDVFGKMERFLDNLRKKGLTLETSRQDDLNWRIALLKKIGAYDLEWNRSNHKYQSYTYAQQKEQSEVIIA